METPRPLERITSFLTLVAASGFGAGYGRPAPGTMGTLAGVLLYWFFFPHAVLPYAALTVLFLAFSVPVCTRAEKLLGTKDDQRIVLDEMVGIWVSLLFLPHKLRFLALAFVLFRFFDVTKVLFVRRLQSLPGGWGIVADDVLAGIWSNIILHTVRALFDL